MKTVVEFDEVNHMLYPCFFALGKGLKDSRKKAFVDIFLLESRQTS